MLKVWNESINTILRDGFLRLLGYMNTDLHTSKQGIDLISKFEGFRSMPYICPAGYLTVGIGIRIPSKSQFLKQFPQGLTLDQAKAQLAERLVTIEEVAVKKLVKVKLTQEQFDALVSFTFNVGKTSLANSTLLKHLNLGDYDKAAKEFKRWNKASINGKMTPLAGLTRRRLAEEHLFEGKEWRTV